MGESFGERRHLNDIEIINGDADVERCRVMNAENTECREMVDLLVDYLDGELGSGTTRDLEKHLKGCDNCLAFLNTYRKAVSLSQKLEYGDIPTELQKRLRDFLSEKMDKGL